MITCTVESNNILRTILCSIIYAFNSEGARQSLQDKMLVNGELINLFLHFDANFLPLSISDHSPSLVYIEYVIYGWPKPFKFFNMSVQHKDFLDVVKEGWNIQIFESPLS